MRITGMTNLEAVEVIRAIKSSQPSDELYSLQNEALTRAIIALRGIKVTPSGRGGSIFKYPNGVIITLTAFAGTLEEALIEADKIYTSITKTQRGGEKLEQ